MNYNDLTNSLVKKCLRNGADEAEVYLENRRRLSIEILNSEIEKVEEASSHGVGFRVIVDGRLGFSHCNDLDNKSLEETLKRAISFARLTTPDKNNIFPSGSTVNLTDDIYDPEIAGISMEKKISLALELESLALSDKRITKSSGSSYSESEGEVFIANSNGISRSYKATACSIGVSVVAEKGEQKNTGAEYCSRRYFEDLLPVEEIAAKAARDAWEMIDPRMIKTQKAPVIVDPDAAPSILGGLISALNGERVLQGASFLKDALNKEIASSLITITDDGRKPRGIGTVPFDGEGVPTQKTVLVDRGVLKSFIYNTSAANRAGTKSTGNASRGGFTRLPGIGTHSIVVNKGELSGNKIIESTQRGLLLKGVTGYGINPVNGNFSGGASGFWIENGQIKHPVKSITIAGNAHSMLNGIDMLGNDLDINRYFASPTFRIREMQIGGK